MKSFFEQNEIAYRLSRKNIYKLLALSTLLTGIISCQKDSFEIVPKPDPVISEAKNFYELELANTTGSIFNSGSLDIKWDEAFISSLINPDKTNNLKSSGNQKGTNLNPQFKTDKSGFIEIVPSTPDYEVVKVPTIFKLKNGKVFTDRLFLYILKDKDCRYSTLLVNYSTNKSLKSGVFTGKVLLTIPDNKTTKSVSIDFFENQVTNIKDVACKNPVPFRKSANLSMNLDYSYEDIIGYQECAPGLVFNESMQSCDWSGGDCSGYYVTSSGYFISACNAEENQSPPPPNSDTFRFGFPFCKYYISFQTLNTMNWETTVFAIISGCMGQIIGAAVLGVLAASINYYMAACPNGIIVNILYVLPTPIIFVTCQ